MSTLDVVGLLLGAGWGLYALFAVLTIRRVGRLPAARQTARGDTAATVAVVITARNERERIRETTQRFAAQCGVSVRVLVVDDRSDDGTERVVEELVAEHSRVESRRIDALPDGWLGKNHACHVGAGWAEAVGADWLLFTDADAWCAPTMVARAVSAAESSAADHVCVVPGERRPSFAARSSLLSFAVAGLAAGGLANRDRYRGPIGVGAFNLVRATSYRAIGGHRRMPLEVLDDATLGELMLRAGYRTRVFAARESVEIAWAASLPGIFRALEKNLFAAFGYRTALTATVVAVGLGAWLGALALGLSATLRAIAGDGVHLPQLVAGLGLATFVAPAWLAARRTGAGLAAALASPIFWPVPTLALARSAWITLRRDGVRWRDTHYPLETLRSARRARMRG